MKILQIITISFLITATGHTQDNIKVLAFSQIEPGIYHHLSNLNGIALLERLGKKRGWDVDVTHDSGSFNNTRLAQYDVVAFINTTGNILNDTQQFAFEQYIQNGGGYLGTHSAADTEHDWEWYGKMIGGYFKSHPEVNQVASVNLENNKHPANVLMTETGDILEEWYNYSANIRSKEGFTVLMTVNESTYTGGEMGDDHPITWAHEYSGGRAFYTGLGHIFQKDHPFLADTIAGGIEWAAGK